jgi:hypothetical protein
MGTDSRPSRRTGNGSQSVFTLIIPPAITPFHKIILGFSQTFQQDFQAPVENPARTPPGTKVKRARRNAAEAAELSGGGVTVYEGYQRRMARERALLTAAGIHSPSTAPCVRPSILQVQQQPQLGVYRVLPTAVIKPAPDAQGPSPQIRLFSPRLSRVDTGLQCTTTEFRRATTRMNPNLPRFNDLTSLITSVRGRATRPRAGSRPTRQSPAPIPRRRLKPIANSTT